MAYDRALFSNYYFNRDGSPSTMEEVSKKRHDALESWIVSRDEFSDGGYVSTVWLGIEHGQDENGKSFIFETMTNMDGEWYDGTRYVSQEDAAAGHEEILREHLQERAQAKRTTHIVQRWRPVPGKFESASTDIEFIEFRFELAQDEKQQGTLPEATQ